VSQRLESSTFYILFVILGCFVIPCAFLCTSIHQPIQRLSTSANMTANKMAGVSVDPSKEEQIYLDDVAATKKWWSDSRWRYTKRPFTAEQIVAKRGNLKIEYPSNAQAKKLWAILEERFKVRCSLRPRTLAKPC
jgi:hypothetical protein